jgi:hypothetical protein
LVVTSAFAFDIGFFFRWRSNTGSALCTPLHLSKSGSGPFDLSVMPGTTIGSVPVLRVSLFDSSYWKLRLSVLRFEDHGGNIA